MSTLLEERRQEFADFIWDHSVDEFQATFDTCIPLNGAELLWLKGFLTPAALSSPEGLANAINAAVAASPENVARLLQLLGLTRNKILQDVKAGVRAARTRVPVSSTGALFRSAEGRKIACGRLAERAVKVFGAFKTEVPDAAFEALNQATWPGFIRQERAKRSGHEAERRLAVLLAQCGLPFEPRNKAINPLCPDARVDGVSYDLVSPDIANPLLRIKSTVHTAVIGQYGESKDDLEIREAVAAIRKSPRSAETTLMALVDGVGLESNRDGLNGVLAQSDEFCQFRTIWKVAVVAACKCKQKITVNLPANQVARFTPFATRFGATLVAVSADGQADPGWIVAGDGWIKMS